MSWQTWTLVNEMRLEVWAKAALINKWVFISLECALHIYVGAGPLSTEATMLSHNDATIAWNGQNFSMLQYATSPLEVTHCSFNISVYESSHCFPKKPIVLQNATGQKFCEEHPALHLVPNGHITNYLGAKLLLGLDRLPSSGKTEFPNLSTYPTGQGDFPSAEAQQKLADTAGQGLLVKFSEYVLTLC